MMFPRCKTKIVCTIGPASNSPEILSDLIRSGMSVARLNFAHGDLDGHRQVIADIRAAAVSAGRRVAIMGDLPGPKMRIGRLDQNSYVLERGAPFVLQTEEIVGNDSRASLTFSGLPAVVKPGDKIFVNDGYIQLAVESVAGQEVHCRVEVGGELRSFKGVNFPGIDLGIQAFTAEDSAFLAFAAEQKLDAVSQSFVQDAADIQVVRRAAAELEYEPFIIAKIERQAAVDNLDQILDATDGLMVARGDLGVEIPIEEIAIVQKKMIRLANVEGKPVITATHMLESMIYNSRPTRAEATDVANAILDGTDCLMLSGETAAGSFPREAVQTMASIAAFTEPYVEMRDADELIRAEGSEADGERLLSMTVCRSAATVRPAIVFAPTLSGDSARLISRFRLRVWILAFTISEATCQQLAFTYGVLAVCAPARPENWAYYAQDTLAAYGISGGLALLALGPGTTKDGSLSQIQFVDLSAKL
jgi:pyruvate kinase